MEGRRPFGLLLAAHGERRTDADNAGIERLARSLAAQGVAAEIGFGFVKGLPTVDDAIGALLSRHVVVYPLFLSDGYFTRVALPRLVEQAKQRDATRTIAILPPLGLEPALADVIAEEAVAAAHSRASLPAETSIVLLAHGSKRDQASRTAAERLADCVRQRQCFYDARIALLEEAPSLADAIEGKSGPIIVVGLFAGEGLHGADDAKRLVAELKRDDVMLMGPVGTFAGIETVIVSAVTKHYGLDRKNHLTSGEVESCLEKKPSHTKLCHSPGPAEMAREKSPPCGCVLYSGFSQDHLWSGQA